MLVDAVRLTPVILQRYVEAAANIALPQSATVLCRVNRRSQGEYSIDLRWFDGFAASSSRQIV